MTVSLATFVQSIQATRELHCLGTGAQVSVDVHARELGVVVPGVELVAHDDDVAGRQVELRAVQSVFGHTGGTRSGVAATRRLFQGQRATERGVDVPLELPVGDKNRDQLVVSEYISSTPSNYHALH